MTTTQPAPDLDIVVVPDFAGSLARVFEERTLLFLASWLEHAGRARRFPLHLACIGPPPPSVRWLAEESGASITIHEPLRAGHGRSCNKLRGLEVSGRAGRILLLDADVVVMAEVSAIAALPSGIAATPPDRARVPLRCWERIYPALDMALPTERIRSVIEDRPRPPFPPGTAAIPRTGMLPYHNSGVLLVPRHCHLRETWEDHIRRIASLFDEGDEAWDLMTRSDQSGLATAIEWLRRQGVPFERLPDRYNVRVAHLYTRAVPLADAALFHATRVFRLRTPGAASYQRKLRDYRLSLIRRLFAHWQEDGTGRARRSSLARQLFPAIMEVHRLVRQLQALHRKHVVRALRHHSETHPCSRTS